MELYIARNEEKLGPFPVAEVQKMIASNKVQPTDLAWHEGLADWMPLYQVPGFSIHATAPASKRTEPDEALPPAQRTAWVWVICLLNFITTPFHLGSLAMIPVYQSGQYPLPAALSEYFQSIHALDYILWAALYIGNLVGSIQLFRMKSSALYIYLSTFCYSVFLLGYNIAAKNWLQAFGASGVISALIQWTIGVAVIWYTWHLVSRRRMR